MSTASGVHSGIVSLLTGAGFTEAPTPYTLDSLPSSLNGEGFMVVRTGRDPGAPTAQSVSVDALEFQVVLPSGLTATPSAKLRTHLDLVDTARAALHGARADSAALDVVGEDDAIDSDGHRVATTLTVRALGTFSH